MEKLVKGDIVVVNFYFTDLNISKRRPAFVIFADENEVILAEITSKSRSIEDISIRNQDFQQGNLKEESWLRPLRLLTLHKSKVAYRIGHLKSSKTEKIIGVICGFFKRK
jgi:mRNA interferase MazF